MIRLKVFAVACLAFAPLAAAASPPPDAAAAFAEAYAGVDALARETRAKGDLPRLSDPRAADVLGRLWDEKRLLGTPPYSQTDVPFLLDLLQKSSDVMKTYIFFTADPARQPQTDRNHFVYQNEITRAQAFILAVEAAITPAITDFIDQLKPAELTDIRKQGMRQTRLGMLEMVTGATLTMRSPGLSPDNQERLSKALAAAAASFASATPKSDRQALSAAAGTALGSATPQARKNLEAFIAAIAAAPCDGLCRIE